MSRVVDLWIRKDKTRTARYGKGKRWQAIRTDGRRGEEKKSFDRKDAAKEWAHSKDRQAEPVTVEEYALPWLARQLHQRDSTRQNVKSKMTTRILPSLGDTLLGEVTRGQVQDAVLEWGEALSPSTVRTVYATLAAMFRDAVLDGLIPSSPCVKIRLPSLGAAPSKILTVEQVQQIADHMTIGLRPAVAIAAATGLRPSEWRGLTVDRVDLERGLIRVDRQMLTAGGFGPPKNEPSDRTVGVGPATVEVLRGLCEGPGEDGLLFHRGGRRLHMQTLGKEWRAMRESLPWAGPGWHMLRHHAASTWLSEGASIVAVSKRLGHVDATETLSTYAHSLPQDDDRITAISDGLVKINRHTTATKAAKVT